MIDVTFIICTRNRAASLARTLDALAAVILEAPELAPEVVLVDNGSTDDTAAVIARWAGAMDFPVIPVAEARPGLAIARNSGVRVARGRLLAFIDDDCRPAPGYLAALMRHFAADEGPTIRGGRVELGDAADLPVTIKPDPHPAWLSAKTQPGGFIHGCNMVMHRQVPEILGPFNERFGAGAPFIAGEDTDLIYRALRHGLPVQYVPDMTVHHHHGRRNPDEARALLRGYQLADGALCMKHLRDLTLLLQFYWELRKNLRLALAGVAVEPAFGLGRGAALWAKLKGMALYWAGPGWRRPQAAAASGPPHG